MYAERTEANGKEHFNLMLLTGKEVGLIEYGLSCIHMNTPEKVDSYKLLDEIDKELSE